MEHLFDFPFYFARNILQMILLQVKSLIGAQFRIFLNLKAIDYLLFKIMEDESLLPVCGDDYLFLMDVLVATQKVFCYH